MSALRLEADDAQAKVEELKTKVRTLEQENLAKEQEITSLNHRNQLLEGEVEKLELSVKEAKDAATQSAQHDTQNEALQRRLQLLEEEAEEADRNLRETNEKYASPGSPRVNIPWDHVADNSGVVDSVKPTSRLAITSVRFRPSKPLVTSGRANMRRWPRSMPNYRKISTISRFLSATSKHGIWVQA